jgi:hypothetical protein
MFTPVAKYFSPIKTTLSFIVFLALSSSCHAEVITLLSGKIVTGKIISRNEEMVRVETSFGIPVTYYLDEIKMIDGEAVSLPSENGLPAEPVEVPGHMKTIETPMPPSFSTEEASPVAGSPSPVIKKIAPATDIKPVDKASSKDIATLEDINVFPPAPPSPAAIKPSEARGPVTGVISAPASRRTSSKRNYDIFDKKISDYKEYWKIKIPALKEKLYAVPLKVRRDILIFTVAFLAALYVVICYPLMKAAQKLSQKHAWLIWLPVVQIFYFIRMADKPLGWSILFLIPGVNLFILFVLFLEISRRLKKPGHLIFFLILPGVNIFALWYLAISRGAGNPNKP